VAKHVRKANISHVVVFVHPFDSPPVKERRDYHLTDFREIVYLEYFTIRRHFVIVRKI
jgi:hypothetical protein